MNRALLLAAAAVLASAPLAAAAQQTTTETAVLTNAQGQPIADASVTAAPPVPNPPPSTTNNNPRENADTGYMGDRQGSSFRDIDQRIAAAETAMAGNRAGMAKVHAIKAEAAQRRARHGGELRDWDRELLNKKLDALKLG